MSFQMREWYGMSIKLNEDVIKLISKNIDSHENHVNVFFEYENKNRACFFNIDERLFFAIPIFNYKIIFTNNDYLRDKELISFNSFNIKDKKKIFKDFHNGFNDFIEKNKTSELEYIFLKEGEEEMFGIIFDITKWDQCCSFVTTEPKYESSFDLDYIENILYNQDD